VGAVYDVRARAEQQEGAGAICALSLALSETLVANERSLLVTDQPTKRHTLEWTIGDLTVHFARRDEAREDRIPNPEKTQKCRVPFKRADVEQESARCVGHLADMLTSAHTAQQVLCKHFISV
jgi:hypothetical protein